MKNINNTTSFEEQFRRKFEGESLNPPSHIWANIENTLPKAIIVPFYKQNWFRAAAAIILVLGSAGWLAYPQFSDKNQNLSNIEQIKVEQIKNSKNNDFEQEKKRVEKASLLKNKELASIDLVKKGIQNKNSQLADNQLVTNKNTARNNFKPKNKNQVFLHSKGTQDNLKQNQKVTPSLTQTIAEVTNNGNISLIDKQKLESLDAVTLALIKAQIESNLPLNELVLRDFAGLPISKQKKEQIEMRRRFLFGLKVAAGSLNLNYSGDNSQNAIGLQKTLDEYRLTNSSRDSTTAIDSDVFDKLRKAKGSQVSAGMELAYFLSPKWSINTGFSVVNSKYAIASEVEHTRAIRTITSSTIQGSTEVTELISNSLDVKWKSINVPLTIAYHIGSKRLQGSISFGVGLNKLFAENYTTEHSEYAYKLGEQKTTYFNSVIGFKLNYKLAPKWYWSTGLDYQNTLGSILNEQRVSLRPETYQANTGLYFSF